MTTDILQNVADCALLPPQRGSMAHVIVLMAAHNGSQWIEAQLDTILAQQGVTVEVIVSDDASTDETRAIVAAHTDSRVRLLPSTVPFGSAASNFFFLIGSLNTRAIKPTAVALSDQDDTWYPEKLLRAVEALDRHGAAAVSSSVMAVWPDGRKKLIQKCHPLKSADHLFESAGPGCTYVLRGDVAMALSAAVARRPQALQEIVFHDWFIYAWVRSNGGNWWIDPTPRMDYRQHEHNVLGARAGWHGPLKRLRWLLGGWYRRQVICIAQACGADQHPAIVRLMRNSWRDRLALVASVVQFRRKKIDRFAVALAFLLGLEGRL